MGTVVSGILNVTVYTYKELQIAAENFSEKNKIGQGGFGSVYKVTGFRKILLMTFVEYLVMSTWLC